MHVFSGLITNGTIIYIAVCTSEFYIEVNFFKIWWNAQYIFKVWYSCFQRLHCSKTFVVFLSYY